MRSVNTQRRGARYTIGSNAMHPSASDSLIVLWCAVIIAAVGVLGLVGRFLGLF